MAGNEGVTNSRAGNEDETNSIAVEEASQSPPPMTLSVSPLPRPDNSSPTSSDQLITQFLASAGSSGASASSSALPLTPDPELSPLTDGKHWTTTMAASPTKLTLLTKHGGLGPGGPVKREARGPTPPPRGSTGSSSAGSRAPRKSLFSDRSTDNWPNHLTLDALIVSLVSPRSHYRLRDVFMLNYRTHIAPHALLSQLLRLYDHLPPAAAVGDSESFTLHSPTHPRSFFLDSPSSGGSGGPLSGGIPSFSTASTFLSFNDSEEKKRGMDGWQAAVQVRVCALLHYWMKAHFADFTEGMKATLARFFKERVDDSDGVTSAPPKFLVLLRAKWQKEQAKAKGRLEPGRYSLDTPTSLSPLPASVLLPESIPRATTPTLRADRFGLSHETKQSGDPLSHPLEPMARSQPLDSSVGTLPGSPRAARRLGGSSRTRASVDARRHSRRPSVGLKKGKRLDLLALSAAEIAKELTISDFAHFSKIERIELTDHMWKKSPERAANVCFLIEQFNNTTYWIAAKILGRKTLAERIDMYMHWLCVAEECVKLHNYHALFYIVSSFAVHQVRRLKELSGVLPPRHQRLRDWLCKLTSSETNYSEYRKHVDMCLEGNVTCILHLGICLKDLLLYETPTPLERSEAVIDIHRLATVAREIDRIDACTRLEYNGLLENSSEKLRRVLDKLRARTVTRQNLIDRSMELEPKMTWKEHSQKLCLAALLDGGFL